MFTSSTNTPSSVASRRALSSEPAFNALWSVIQEVNDENATDRSGNHLFSSNPQFNLELSRFLGGGHVSFTCRHWNRLVWYAATEVKSTRLDGHFTREEIESNQYGAALSYVTLLLAIRFGEATAQRIMHAGCRHLIPDCYATELAQAVALKLVAPPVGTNEPLASIVIRQMMTPPQLMSAIKLSIRGMVRNETKKYRRETALNPLTTCPVDTVNELYTTESYGSSHTEITHDTLQFDYLQELLNRAFDVHGDGSESLFTTEELELLELWQQKGETTTAKTFKEGCKSLGPLIGISPTTARTRAVSIIQKFRQLLGITIIDKMVEVVDYKHPSRQSKIKQGQQDPTQARRSGKSAERVLIRKTVQSIESPFVDGEDGQLLRDMISQGAVVFASLNKNEMR